MTSVKGYTLTQRELSFIANISFNSKVGPQKHNLKDISFLKMDAYSIETGY